MAKSPQPFATPNQETAGISYYLWELPRELVMQSSGGSEERTGRFIE